MSRIQDQIRSLDDTLRTLNAENDALRARVADLEQRLAQSNEQRDVLRDMVHGLRTQNDQLLHRSRVGWVQRVRSLVVRVRP